MKLKKWIPALLLAAVASQAASRSVLSPVETYGPLATKAGKLVDSTGKAVTLRGMSLFWHLHMGGKEFWTRGAMSWAMTDWHASIIRAPIGVDDVSTGNGDKLIGAINDTANANDYIHRAINAAIECGLYVIVDWHAEGWRGGDASFQNAAKKFFGNLAKEYGNTPNILWELYNEPSGVSDFGSIANYANAVIPEIRKYNQGIIIVGNQDWDKNPDQAGTQLDNYSNIAYTVHFYNDQAHQGTVANAMAKNHAVFATEWGMSDHTGGGSLDLITGSGNISKWISTLDNNGVSSCNWSLGNPKSSNGTGTTSEASAALKLGVSFSGGWTDADLTASGASIRTYLRSKNPAWTMPDTSLKFNKAFAIVSPKTTNFTLKADSIEITASYNKGVAWLITETGRTNGGVKTTEGTGAMVQTKHLVGSKDNFSASFALGETVDVTLTPQPASGAKTLSYTISSTPGAAIIHRVHETKIAWEGTRLDLPSDLIAQGTPVRVMLRDAAGQITWQAPATMGFQGRVELSQMRPRTTGLQILDVMTAEGAYVRARLAPNF